jgi:hypothetical protein
MSNNTQAPSLRPNRRVAVPARSFQSEIAQMDRQTLAGIVSRAYGRALHVVHWRVEPLGMIDLSTQVGSGGVYRVWGQAADADGFSHNWSLVVKVLKSPAGMVMPSGFQISQQMAEVQDNFGYWKREALVHQSGIPGTLPAGLVVPPYVELMDQGDVIWLWQSEISDERAWSWADYREAAYRLGLWQGQQVASPQLPPDYPWLSRHWLRRWTEIPLNAIVQAVDQADGWHFPLAKAYFAPEEVDQLRQLWAGREQRLAALTAGPQSVSHLDAYRSNMFWQGDDLTLIDWAFVGLAAVGEELAAFVGATLLLDHLPMSEATRLEAVAIDGYLAGLSDAGWSGDPTQVTRVYRHAMPLRYGLISFASILRTAVDPQFVANWERKTGLPLEEILRQRSAFIRFLLAVDSERDRRYPAA